VTLAGEIAVFDATGQPGDPRLNGEEGSSMESREYGTIDELLRDIGGSIHIERDRIVVQDVHTIRDRLIDRLVWSAVFGDDAVKNASRWLIRALAPEMGAWPASIHDLYMAAGRREYANVTTPAINVRAMAYDMARNIFRSMHATETRQVIFELARSETSYTDQRPAEYASAILGAAIKEGYAGPIFIQGDHYQASAKDYAADPGKEMGAVRDLAIEALHAGYGNIDVDASTLVDLDRGSLAEQQRDNYEQTAALTLAIREHEPEGITVSIGGEIGEVGKQNSTTEDLEAFMTGYQSELDRLSKDAGRKLEGISKISVQTGTSHGGVMLPDGTIKKVSVDFDTLAKLSAEAKDRYGLGGAVQHGASTLPEEAFGKFAEADAVEVHLATGFQNIIYDHEAFPTELTERIHAWLAENRASERKPDMTDAQFYYTTRKRAFGPFKRDIWSLSDDAKAAIGADLRVKFDLIMHALGVAGRGDLVDRFVERVDLPVGPAPDALTSALAKA
jgi:fructose/tagatose bisphosphate aldolase